MVPMLPPVSETLLLPAKLNDRYLIERELDHGEGATAYLARDLRDNRRVTVKVLRPELVARVDPEMIVREIGILRTLEHHNILRVVDVGRAHAAVNGPP